MEAYGQKYSVLVKTQVREKMLKEIDQISEVFSLSQSDATVVLTRLQWNSFKAADLLGDNKEKFLAELGLGQASADGDTTNLSDGYLLESFVECQKERIKWCPASGCDYAILLREDIEDDIGVVCLCGHTFCWTCQHESHRPVTCKKASIWWTYLLDQSRSLSWIHSNTKRCPNCNSPVQQNGDPDYRLITCICSYSFCWICLRTEEEHNGKWNCAAVSGPVADSSSTEHTQILHLNLWEAGHEELEKAKANLKSLEENRIPQLVKNCGLSEMDIRTIRDAGMILVQCRQVLKWICVYEFLVTESTKKQYLIHRRDQASTVLCKHEDTLGELMNRAKDEGDFTCIKHMLETSTTYTGNYFHEFVKNLEDGMPEVKNEADEDGQSSHRFCERCTFENSWADTHCQMCLSLLDSPPPLPHVVAPEDPGKLD